MFKNCETLNKIVQSIHRDVPRDKFQKIIRKLSHDIRTPLAGSISALRMHKECRSKLNPDQLDELIDMALSQSERMDATLTSLLGIIMDDRRLKQNTQFQ